MIDDLDRTIAAVLPKTDGISDISIDFYPPTRDWQPAKKPALNVFLYDVGENDQRRQYHWQSVVGTDQQVSRQQPPLFYDCTYLITCWAETPQDEHRLLTRCLRTLAQNPGLSKTPRYGLMADIDDGDIVTHLGRPAHLPNPADIWTALNNTPRPMLIYVVTLPISLEPEPEEAGLVHTVGFSWQQIQAAPNGQSKHTTAHRAGLPQPGPLPARNRPETALRLDSYLIAGTVLDANGQPLKNVAVSVAGGVTFALTNENGRYRLGRLPPGHYTLLAQPAGRDITRKEISLRPVGEGNGPNNFDWTL